MLARAGQLARQRPVAPAVAHRNASTSSHDEHHHDDHHHVEEDTTVYPKEGFTGPVWRTVFLASALGIAAYNYAPEPNEDAYLTRWLKMYSTSSEKCLDMNAAHTAQSKDAAETTQLLTTAIRPPVHRYRFPQMLDNASPFLNSVGMNPDMSKVTAKNEHQW